LSSLYSGVTRRARSVTKRRTASLPAFLPVLETEKETWRGGREGGKVEWRVVIEFTECRKSSRTTPPSLPPCRPTFNASFFPIVAALTFGIECSKVVEERSPEPQPHSTGRTIKFLPPSLPLYLQRILLANRRRADLRHRVGKRGVRKAVPKAPLHGAIHRLEAIEGVGALLAGLGVVLVGEGVLGVRERKAGRRIDLAWRGGGTQGGREGCEIWWARRSTGAGERTWGRLRAALRRD